MGNSHSIRPRPDCIANEDVILPTFYAQIENVQNRLLGTRLVRLIELDYSICLNLFI